MSKYCAMEELDIYKSYQKSPYLSIKHSSYFQVYAELLDRYRDKTITFVEVGVLNGGSLFMWRDYFGPRARIIGVDFNPEALRWKKDGFDIFVGSQSDSKFWKSFFDQVGAVDIVLDDGGHRFEQQIITVDCCIPHITEGGMIIVEDTHTSYLKDFGYPTRYSFIEWTKRLVDNVNSRFPSVKVSSLPYKNSIYSISFFESIVCFKIHRSRCFESSPISNDARSFEAEDFRYKDTGLEDGLLTGRLSFLRRLSFLKRTTAWQKAKEFSFSRSSASFTRKALRRHFDASAS